MELFIRTAAGTIAFISFIICFGICLTSTTQKQNWLSFGLAFVLIGVFSGLTGAGTLIAIGTKEINRIVWWTVGFGIFGMLSFLPFWVQHRLIIPRMLNFLSRMASSKKR
jgi:hypothetical protein